MSEHELNNPRWEATPNTRARWDACPVQLAVVDKERKPISGPHPVRPAYAHDLDEWLEQHPVLVVQSKGKA
jgi:hypothetical protein